MLCSYDAIASAFAAKFQGKVFVHVHEIAIKHHSSVQN
jgi:hypothetical protein